MSENLSGNPRENNDFLPTRREVDPSYEKSEIYHAMQVMRKCGLVTSMNKMELYHGRSGDLNDGLWQVDPTFDNAGDKTGNRNINKIAALSTGTLEVASDFARARARGRKAAMVHRIISEDTDAAIMRDSFIWYNLAPEQQREFKQAMVATLPGALKAAPLLFEEREVMAGVRPKDLTVDKHGLAFMPEILKSANELGIGVSVSHRVSAARNTRQILKEYPNLINKLVRAFTSDAGSIGVRVKDGQGRPTMQSLPISREYLANWFRQMHIVGVETPVYSGTLGREIDNYMLFDTEKVNTVEAVEAKKRTIARRMGMIALEAEKHQIGEKAQPLGEALSDDLYITPRKIVELAKKTPGYKEIFEAQTGNREGYTLEEHTETVLRLFDENYADRLPATVLPVMRMALLVHDLGKPKAAKKGERRNQKPYNLAEAKRFMEKNGVDQPTERLILAMIGEGMEYTEQWMVHGDESVRGEFYQFCKRTMQDYLGITEVDSATVTGFRHLLEVLQNCDSGAYTSMGITHSQRTGVAYRNLGAFDDSFEEFRGLTGQRVRLKHPPQT